MLHKKESFPEEGEIVLCTVKKILPNSVFVVLDEYRDREGIVHISEISPGRIRSIRDFVTEGKKIVCKILRVNQQRNQIDLSLRRVTTSMQIAKSAEAKLELKAEKILEIVAQQNKTTKEEVFKGIGEKLINAYGSLSAAFNEIYAGGERALQAAKIEGPMVKKLAELIQVRMKPAEVEMTAVIRLQCRASNGVDIIKKVLQKTQEAEKAKKREIQCKYLGAPRYSVTLKAMDYKSGEIALREITDSMIQSIEKEGGEGSIEKK